MELDNTGFNPVGGDHRSTPGRFDPLPPDNPAVGKACIVCGHKLEAGDIPTLISLAPADIHEAKKKDSGKPYSAVGGVAHQSCAWPGEART